MVASEAPFEAAALSEASTADRAKEKRAPPILPAPSWHRLSDPTGSQRPLSLSCWWGTREGGWAATASKHPSDGE